MGSVTDPEIVMPLDRWGRTVWEQVRSLRDTEVRSLSDRYDPPRPGTAREFMAQVAAIDAKWAAVWRRVAT